MPDHLLVAGGRTASMRTKLYIPEKLWMASGPLVKPLAQWR